MKTRLGENYRFIALIFFLLMFIVMLIRSAWMSDDAYITFRTIDNFTQGYGLTWNIHERVETYSHPLWFIVMTILYHFTNEYFYTCLIFSIILSITSVGLLLRKVCKDRATQLICMISLISFRGFIDYSTSGLENPLSNLIMVCFAIVYLKSNFQHRKDFFFLFFISSLGVLNRMDMVLLYVPMLIYVYYKFHHLNHSTKIFMIIAGYLPFLMWKIFALFYYGFLIPNTAYAKLNAGIPTMSLLSNGMNYLLDFFIQEPLPCISILSLMTIVVIMHQKKAVGYKHLVVTIGILLYILYLVKIGGGFMRGRFVVAPFLLGLLLFSDLGYSNIRKHLSIGFLRIYCYLMVPSLLLSMILIVIFQVSYIGQVNNIYGIADERRFYFQETSLLSPNLKHQIWYKNGLTLREKNQPLVVIHNALGFYGVASGKNVHIVDPLALSDPLLSKLPITPSHFYIRGIRPGHFERNIPRGYLESLQYDENRIVEENMKLYFEKIKVITTGELWSFSRLKTIFAMNIGAYDHLLDNYINSKYYPNPYDEDVYLYGSPNFKQQY
jgi:arabinofuranosyltransferase